MVEHATVSPTSANILVRAKRKLQKCKKAETKMAPTGAL